MCIALVTTLHPDYPLILLDNRDVSCSPYARLHYAAESSTDALALQEFLNRPTAPAAFWPSPNKHVLGGRDLLRDEHGTWLGITRQGRIAVLTNFREEVDSGHPVTGARSRGAMVNAWLKLPIDSTETTQQFIERLCGDDSGLKGVGGFSLVCGQLQRSRKERPKPLAVVSNRTPHPDAATWIAGSSGEVHGLSNSAYDDPWPKVKMGEELVREAIEASVDEREEATDLIERLLTVLSTDTLPKRKEGQSFETYLGQLRYSIFIPAIAGEGTESGSAQDIASAMADVKLDVLGPEKKTKSPAPVYGTQKQTVVLVDLEGQVTFVERTLFDSEARPVQPGDGDRVFRFNIEPPAKPRRDENRV
ncbi:MAG: hypothetical protein M1832_003561 [Thelocarpon impressellum]|nr:MAG: hypothetical protein M1832_003561 [Thelocarpon impressellum]